MGEEEVLKGENGVIKGLEEALNVVPSFLCALLVKEGQQQVD